MVVLQRKKSKAQERVEDSAERMEGLRGLDFSQTEEPSSVAGPSRDGGGARGDTGGDDRFDRTSQRADGVRSMDFGADNFGLPGPDSSGWGSGSTGANAAERGGVASPTHDPSKVPQAKDPANRARDPAARTDEEIARNPGPADDPAPDPDVDGDGLEFGEIARIREQQERERAAMREDRERSRAEAILDADSRAGLGGMGLSGATSALIGDTARVQDRETTLQEAALGRQHRDEEWLARQRQIALWDFELADGRDYDGDGEYGPPGDEEAEDDEDTPQNDARQESAERQRQNEENREEYGDLPVASYVLDGGEEIARYTDEDGTVWLVMMKDDGTMYRSSGVFLKDLTGGAL